MLIKKRKKNNVYGFLKEFTNLLKRRQLLDKEICSDLTKRYKVDYWILKRLWSYFYTRPKIVWYLNQNINNIFDFRKVELEDHFLFLQQLYVLHNMQPKDVYYLKSDAEFDSKREEIKKLIEQYFETCRRVYRGQRDVNEIVKLIVDGVIDGAIVNEINKLINGLDAKEIITDVLQRKRVQGEQQSVSAKDSEQIRAFINKIKNMKFQREECRKCELFNNQIVVLDTNVTEPQPVDFFFFGINPGREEREKDCPMIGTSGRLLREQIIDQLPVNIKWVISNVILCSTNNINEIKNANDCLERCKGIVSEIFRNFPPKYIVTVGDIPTKYFGVNEKISKVSGELLANKLIPCVHPSSVRRGNKYMEECFQRARMTILQLANQLSQRTDNLANRESQKQVVIESESESSNENWLEDIDKSWSFFDCCRLDNNDILLIFIDQNGQKHYKRLHNVKQSVYIKFANHKECSIITDKVDAIIYVNDYEKSKLAQLLRQQITI